MQNDSGSKVEENKWPAQEVALDSSSDQRISLDTLLGSNTD